MLDVTAQKAVEVLDPEHVLELVQRDEDADRAPLGDADGKIARSN